MDTVDKSVNKSKIRHFSTFSDVDKFSVFITPDAIFCSEQYAEGHFFVHYHLFEFIPKKALDKTKINPAGWNPQGLF